MKRKFISVALFGALLAASTSVTTSCKDYDDDISGLQGQITANATNLDELVNEKVNNLTQEINSLKAQEAALETALATAKTELTATIAEAEQGAKDYADIQAAAAQVAAIEASKANIEEARMALQAGIDAANAAIEALNSQVATQAGQIDALLSADAALQEAINIANGEIESAKSMAATAQSVAEAAQGTADENAQKIAGVTEKLQAVEEGLQGQITLLDEKLNQTVADIAANKADVEAKLATVNALVQANTEAISALQDKDAELLDKIAQNSTELLALSEKLTALQSTVEQNLTAAKAYTDAQVAALKAELGADMELVKADLAGALSRLGAAEEKIAAIQEAVGALEDKDEELAATIAEVEGNIESINTSIGGILGRLETLEGTVAQQNLDIETLKQTAAGLRTDLDAVKVTADEAKSQIVQLTSDFNSYVSANNEALVNLENRMSNKLDEAVSTLGSELRSELTTATGELDTKIGELQGDLQEKYEALKNQIGAITGDEGTVGLIDEKINAVNQKVAELGTKVENLTTDLTALTGRVTTVETEIGEIYKQLAQTSAIIGQCINVFNAELGQLCAMLSAQLRSIVFSPTEYYQGIEAIGVFSFNYNALSVSAADKTGDQKTDRPTMLTQPETSVVPFVKASYHLNPSNAAISTDKEHFSYVVNNASYTRSVGRNDISVDSVELDKEETGMLNVYFSMKNANDIEKIPAAGDGKVDVAALRYTYSTENGDTLITSDYAALKQYKITDFAINKVTARGNMEEKIENHLAATAAEALTSNNRLQITYENKDPYADSETTGLDLNEWINVHYVVNDANTDQVWGDQEKINEKKFKLVYELIGYKANDADKTSESEHATIVDGHILNVHGVDGSPAGNRNIIGRTPLLRVTLVDENTNNQIAEVGYILVEITDVIVGPVTVDDIAPITNGYTVNCDDAPILDNVRAVTWVEVENKILGQLNMSKEEFEANYALELNSDGVTCKQFSEPKDEAVRNPQIGKIVNTNDDQAHETNVLKWSVGNQQAYMLFSEDRQNLDAVSTWVKFTPKSTVSSHKPVFVKLTWAPSVVNDKPEAAIEDSYNHKKRADWHAENSRDEGFKELQIQVGKATDPSATCEYEHMVVANTFNKQPVDIIKDAIKGTYGALADAVTVEYKFAPTNEQSKRSYIVGNTTYNIQVSADGRTISTTGGVTLATIEPTNGEITMGSDDVVKAIINIYEESLADALTFTVLVDEATCEPAKDLIAFNNNKFNVKVIKPIFLKGGSIAEMTLNQWNTLTQKLSLTFEDFNGYDPKEFYDYSNKTKTFWDFYGVSRIELVGTETDYSGNWGAVDNNVFTISYTEPTGSISLDNMGSVTLTQVNMSRANSFNVRMTFKVTYLWGELTETVTLHVNNAPGKRSLNR